MTLEAQVLSDLQHAGIVHWQIDPELAEAANKNYRTTYALSLKDCSALEIVQALTFDGQSQIDLEGIEDLLSYVERNFIGSALAGVGLELGAGPGSFSAAFAKRPAVRRMYAVELCAPIVETLLPKVMREILGEQANKVVGAVGDFNHMQLDSQSVDFVFDFFALHHSTDLTQTLKECSRVLRPGGCIVCFDKARPDYFSDQDLDQLLDVEYDLKYKCHFGICATEKLTRRMNGEREYRLRDWQQAFLESGFSTPQYHCLCRVAGQGLSLKLKKLIAALPVAFQSQLNSLLPWSTPKHKFRLDYSNRVFSERINSLPKEISLLIATKV